MEQNMQTFQSRIKDVAHRKAVSRQANGKRPSLQYYALTALDQQKLVMALVNEDPEIRARVSMKITHALEDAYCDIVRPSEALDDAIDIANWAAEELALDNVNRVRDMNLAVQGR